MKRNQASMLDNLWVSLTDFIPFSLLMNAWEIKQNELGIGRVEGRSPYESSSENSRAWRTAGQTEERKAAEAVSAWLSGSRTAEAEAEGINHFLKQFAVFGLVHFLVEKRSLSPGDNHLSLRDFRVPLVSSSVALLLPTCWYLGFNFIWTSVWEMAFLHCAVRSSVWTLDLSCYGILQFRGRELSDSELFTLVFSTSSLQGVKWKHKTS